MDLFRAREEEAEVASEAAFLDGIRDLLSRNECKQKLLADF